jgi:hypothetical protein
MTAPRARLAVLVAVAACGDGGPAGPDAAPPDASPLCLEAVAHSDYAWLEREVFARSCAGSRSCHRGSASEADGLVLEAGQAYDALVDVAARGQPSFRLVVPGDPEASYLMIAIGAVPGPLPKDGRMPLRSPALCQEKIDALRRWIAAGAARN